MKLTRDELMLLSSLLALNIKDIKSEEVENNPVWTSNMLEDFKRLYQKLSVMIKETF